MTTVRAMETDWMTALEGIAPATSKRKTARARRRLAFAPATMFSFAPRLLFGKASKRLVSALGCRTTELPCTEGTPARQSSDNSSPGPPLLLSRMGFDFTGKKTLEFRN